MPYVGDALRKLIEVQIPAVPASQHLGWRCLEIDSERGTIATQFEARSEFVNPGGMVQGGFLAAMLDNTISAAIHATLEPNQYPVTLEINVSFIHPAKPGPLIGHGRVIHVGRSIGFLAGELRTPDDVLIATATATARIVELRKD